MDIYEVSTFTGYAVAVFILASCFYRRHVRRLRLFFVGVGLFGAAILLQMLHLQLMPTPFSLGMSTPPPPLIARVLNFASQLAMCGTLPVFFAACCGSLRAYPQCSICGYDLTGNTSGTCPECGQTFSESPPRQRTNPRRERVQE